MASSSALSVLYPSEGAISTSSNGKSSRMAPPSPGPLTPLFTRIVVPLNARSQLAEDRKSTRLNSSHVAISYAVFCLKKKKKHNKNTISNNDIIQRYKDNQ